MSGKPNQQGAIELIKALKDVAWCRDRITELEDSITKEEASLESYKRQRGTAYDNVQELLAEMDVKSSGNTGYEARHFELLLLMATK